jgi:hypothetical protein
MDYEYERNIEIIWSNAAKTIKDMYIQYHVISAQKWFCLIKIMLNRRIKKKYSMLFRSFFSNPST